MRTFSRVLALVVLAGCGGRSGLWVDPPTDGSPPDRAAPPEDATALDVVVADVVVADVASRDATTLDAPSVDAVAADAPSPEASPADSALPDAPDDAAPDAPLADLPPSCAPGGPGMTDCGPTRESCCTSLLVEGGTFYRTYTNSGAGPTGEADPATVSSFRLDKYEVTVGRYRQFMKAWAAGYVPDPGSGKHTHLNQGQGLVQGGDAGAVYEPGWVATPGDMWITPQSEPGTVFNYDAGTATNYADGGGSATWFPTWTGTPGPHEKLPINYVRWYEAYAFCIWDGGFLPSEAEWEYAAAGGAEQREYPWGSTDPGTKNQYAIYRRDGSDCYYPDGGMCMLAALGFAPVGTTVLGGGKWEQLDLAGNASEWTLDCGGTPYLDPCVDCASWTGNGGYYSDVGCGIRGGMYMDWVTNILPTSESGNVPEDPNPTLSIRCARAP
jgi:formylglycine-generating enzyme required for sulfatase activity